MAFSIYNVNKPTLPPPPSSHPQASVHCSLWHIVAYGLEVCACLTSMRLLSLDGSCSFLLL